MKGNFPLPATGFWYGLALLLSACATGDRDMVRGIDTLMQPYSGQRPGASVLVMREGKPLMRRAWGFANLEEGIEAGPETNYRLASVTKQFTAAAILLLARDGALQLDDPVRKWLPSLPAATDAITIRHLLTHTSGMIDYEDLIPESTNEQVRDADVLRLLESENRAYFPPGSSYRYSNSGYALLALIIERASGNSYATFLRERIFEPLGMSRSVAYEQGVSTVPDRAYGYSRAEEGWIRNDQSLTSAVLGDGGIYSSIDDLAKWDAALDDETLLGAEWQRLAFTPSIQTDKPGVSYGFGWRIEDGTLWHSGETRGFRNAILQIPDKGLTIIILTNRNEGKPYELAKEIARRLG